MGELIRKIGSVKFGDTLFDIELNEGYTKGSNECIHIQNCNFRYQMSVKDFYRASALVKESRARMTSEKLKLLQNRSNSSGNYSPVSEAFSSEKQKIASLLSSNSIEYRYIGGLENCLTFLIDPSFVNRVSQVFKKGGLVEYQHPISELNGYTFLYQMDPFQLYKTEQCYIEIWFQIPCMSLTKKTWIPLDKQIQIKAFEEINKIDGINEICDEVRMILALSWAILKRREFSSYEIQYISANAFLFENNEFRKMLEKVFFNFTDTLIICIKSGSFERLIEEYYTNCNY